MKRSTYKLSFILTTLLVITFTLGGCKSSENSNKEGTATPTESVATPTENADTKGQTDATGDVADETTDAKYAMQMGTVDVQVEDIFNEDFEDGQTDFTGRGSAKGEIVSDKAYEGAKSLFVSGRSATWNGASINLTEELKIKESYLVDAYLMYEVGPDTIQIDCKVEKNSSQYLNFGSTTLKKGEWTQIKGKIIIPEDTTTASVYFETVGDVVEFIDFYVDNFSITKEMVTADRGVLPALKDAYQDYFSVGVAVTANEIADNRQELIKEQFNSLTPGNELKADSVLDYDTCISDPKYDENPAVHFNNVESVLQFAQASGIPVRGHTLVWHSQTPRWFFAVGYSKEATAPLVSKDLMLKRMENYIKQVLEYTQETYPGLIYAWDVVNEAVLNDGAEDGLRSKDSLWYQVIGPEFIEKAFEYARKYAEKDVKLFYNDFNTEEKGKSLFIYKLVEKLNAKNLIDGIGLQSHFTVEGPSLVDFDSSVRKYAELGLEIQITELDMGMEGNTEEDYMKQAMRYKRLFTMIKKLEDDGISNITNVTFWGLTDDISWLNKTDVPSYPLLFDQYLLQKYAFWGVIMSPDIPLY